MSGLFKLNIVSISVAKIKIKNKMGALDLPLGHPIWVVTQVEVELEVQVVRCHKFNTIFVIGFNFEWTASKYRKK